MFHRHDRLKLICSYKVCCAADVDSIFQLLHGYNERRYEISIRYDFWANYHADYWEKNYQ